MSVELDEQKIESFKETLLENSSNFARILAKNIDAMLDAKLRPGQAEYCEQGLVTSGTVFVSILFTGTVFGEFIISLSGETAAQLMGQSLQGASEQSRKAILNDAGDALAELLNITVGETITGLKNLYKKITITAPKVYFGEMRYPRIHNGRTVLEREGAPDTRIECYFYIDRMKLDIAASYKQVLVSLLEANKELRSALGKLEAQQEHLIQSEKLIALGTMAAGVAHEINTPLATISLLGGQMKDIVGEEPMDKGTFVQMLDLIERTTIRISKITQALRTYAQGGANEPFQATTVSAVMDETTLLCRSYIEGSGVKLTIASIPHELELECKVYQISQVLQNLIKNAFDEVRSLAERWIQVECSDADDYVELRITDSGKGIPAKVRDKIFDPFFTTKGVGKGTGLGLSISKGIVDAHHGELFVNRKAPNTQFVLRLPKRQPQKQLSKKSA